MALSAKPVQMTMSGGCVVDIADLRVREPVDNGGNHARGGHVIGHA